MQKEITRETEEKFEKSFESDIKNRVAMNSVVKNGINAAAENFAAFRETRHEFSITIETGEITNQKASGRCWMLCVLKLWKNSISKPWN